MVRFIGPQQSYPFWIVFLAGLGLALSIQPSQAQITPKAINQPCTACEVTSIHAADLEGDGDPDVVSISPFDDKVAWYENTGGAYGEQQVISTSTETLESVYAADLDDDGDKDVIAGSDGDDEIVWYENKIGEPGADSDGFGPAQVIASSHGPVFTVAADDVDGDGKADVVAGTGGSGVIWFESQIGESGGDFSGANTIASWMEAVDPNSIALADLSDDDDGPDVLYSALGEVAWHENTGGGFGGKKSIASPTGANTVIAADLAGDGDLDVAVSSSVDGNITWYENTGGAFGSASEIGGSIDPQSVAAADADGDGDADLFAGILGSGGGDDTVVWYESQVGEPGADGDGFGDAQVITTTAQGPADVETANVDGGSDPELLSASELDDKIAWYENTGGSFGTPQPVNAWSDAIQPQSVVAAPIDNDADADILVGSLVDSKVSWYENTDGQGAFSDQNVIASDARRVREAVAADLNDDGKPDAIVASDGPLDGSEVGMVAWYENQTGESGADSDGFGSRHIIAEEEGVSHVFAADIDGDNDKDVLATYGTGGTGEQSLVWYENRIDEGAGFSAEHVIAGSLTLVESLHVADLNGGGNDVVLGHGSPYDNPKLVWYDNTDGSGTFSSEKVIEAYGDDTAISLATADVDGDSDLDLVAGIFDTGPDDQIAWYENEIGQGGDADGFSAKIQITSAVARPLGLHLADLNDSGNPDLLSASRDDDKVAWYTNSGGSFSAQKIISSFDQGVVQGAVSVSATDVNQDGDTDVLSASTGRERVDWYENTNGVLPVEMAGFDADVDGETIRLSWTTASEQNNAGFRVQRKAAMSNNNKTGASSRAWTTVGRVEGSGTTSEAQSYRFTDTDLPYDADVVTYRLKQVDTDGSTHISRKITVERRIDEVELLGTYPNPVREQATIRYAVPETKDVTVALYDVLGRPVRTVVRAERKGRHEEEVDVRGLSSGVYFVRLQAGGQVQTQKVTVLQ